MGQIHLQLLQNKLNIYSFRMIAVAVILTLRDLLFIYYSITRKNKKLKHPNLKR